MNKRSKVTLAIAGGVVALAIACGGCVGLAGISGLGSLSRDNASSDGGATSAPASSSPKATDDVVQVTKCAMSSNRLLGAEATVSVTNRSTRQKTFLVTVAVVSEDGAQQYATINFAFQDLGPGQTATDTVTALEDRSKFPAKFVCKVTSVESF